ncbi:MAG: tetratricopeptide repeat protein [Calditrichaeota bacterium]|nr:tetratricopeptide repeat protein [Calditrichota bacterium]
MFNAEKSYNAGIEIIQKEPEKDSHPQANKYFEETIDKCWKLIEIYSDKSKYADDALLYIIKSEYYVGKYAQARVHTDQFLQKYPESELVPEANLWYGKLLLKDGQIQKGKEYLNKVINISSNSRLKAEAYYELGNLAFEDENYGEAIRYFEDALKEKIDEQYAAFINYYLGESYFQQKMFKKAIDFYKKVEKYSPSLDIEYKTKLNWGKSYAQTDNFREAEETLRKMLTAPRFKAFIPQIKTELATVYYLQDKKLEAVALYKEVVKSRVASSGTAEASYKLGQIYEKDIQNIDSSVHYYGEVKKIFSKYDSIEQAEDKYFFLSELKKIRDNIKKDKFLVHKLENDSYFRDSLYTAQYEDSILRLLGKKPVVSQEMNLTDLDTTNLLYSMTIPQLDSLKQVIGDTLQLMTDDTLKTVLQDSLEKINTYMLLKAPKTEQKMEKRKLPQIKEDLKEARYQLAQFFLLQTQNYDSAITHYTSFLNSYSDSVLTPKAIYSLYYIYDLPAYMNPGKRDSLKNILINEYQETAFARKINPEKTVSVASADSSDSLKTIDKNLFMRAESLYFNQDIDSALTVYERVASLDSTSIWSAKAQLARAWIYEKDLNDIDRAIIEYTKLKNNFHQPEMVALASKKVQHPAAEIKGETPAEPIPQDSLYFAQTAISDSTETVRPGISDTGDPQQGASTDSSLPSVNKTREFREWRINRMLQN